MSGDDPWEGSKSRDGEAAEGRSVHVFLEDTVESSGFEETVSRLVDAALQRTGGGMAAVSGSFPLAKSFALHADASVIDALQGLQPVKRITEDTGDFLPPPASRRTLD